jgi:twitching motility protein PilT
MGLFTKKPTQETTITPSNVARTVPIMSSGERGAFAPIGDILKLAVESDASDIHLTAGSPPTFRINGSLVRLETRALFPEDTDNFARDIANGTQIHALQTEGSVDFAMTHDGRNRFRVSLYKQKGTTALAMRLLPKRMLSLEEIGLPRIAAELIRMPRGLVLVTGPTGSGKTTSLAAMLNAINAQLGDHIVTIEDPIEYVHEHQSGLINQREVGTDVPSFPEGLRRALRQDPDVILSAPTCPAFPKVCAARCGRTPT